MPRAHGEHAPTALALVWTPDRLKHDAIAARIMTPREAIQAAVQEAMALDAPLQARLDHIHDAVRRHNAPFDAGNDRMVARLEAARITRNVPGVGAALPAFALPDHEGRLVKLSDLLGAGPLAVVFHRGPWCAYCRTHALALGQASHRVKALGGRVIAIAPNRQSSNLELRELGGNAVPILSDIDNAYAIELGLAFWVGDEMRAMKLAHGYDLATHHGNDDWLLPIPATFVLDAQGVIAARHIDPDYRRRMEMETLIEAVQALV